MGERRVPIDAGRVAGGRARGRFSRVAGAMLLAGGVGCGERTTTAPAPRVTVLVASSLRPAIDDLVRVRSGGDVATATVGMRVGEPRPGDVRIASGPSNALAMQVRAGAPADVLVVAHPRWIDALERDGLVRERAVIARNALVVVRPANSVRAPANVAARATAIAEVLADPAIGRVAIAARNVPLGTYSEQALATAGVLEELRESNRLVAVADARRAIAAVARGDVDAGVVYESDARDDERVVIVAEVPAAAHEPIVIEAALLVRANGPADDARAASARRFFETLVGLEARDILLRHGLRAP